MTVRTVKLSGLDWASGDVLYAADLNDTINSISEVPDEVYTDTGFDAIQDESDDHTLTVDGAIIERYVMVAITVTCTTTGSTLASSSVSIKIETSEKSAGSWTTLFNKTILATAQSDSASTGHTATQTVKIYYAPTSGEKTNGLDIRITGTGTQAGGTSCSIANVQTVIYVL